MLNITLVKVNSDTPLGNLYDLEVFKEKLDNSTGVFRYSSSILEFEIVPLKTIAVKNEYKALQCFNDLLLKRQIHHDKHAILIHEQASVSSPMEVRIAYFKDKSLHVKRIVNPLYRGVIGVKRSTSRAGLEVDVNSAMQSQLFAMLDSSGGDSPLNSHFSIKDTQKEAFYKWEDKAFFNDQFIAPREMVTLAKNILSVARLPWINIDFKLKGDSCHFSLSTPSGTSSVDVAPKKASGSSTRAQQNATDFYEFIGDSGEKPFRLSISNLRLTFITSWGLTEHILIHEIAHYISFMMPTPYLIGTGPEKINQKEYDLLFSGHGMLYVSIFTRLMIDFCNINNNSIYQSLDDDGIRYFKIKNLKPEHITNTITENIGLLR
jgi:hypothetical protein